MSEALRLDPGIEHAKFVARRDMWLKLPAGSAAPHRALLMWLPLPQSRSAYIGRGTTLVVSPHVMHRHPLHWEAPADEADPRRFAAEATAARPPGAYIPFSAGRKRCIAMGHALQQLQLVIAEQQAFRNLVQRGLPGGGYFSERRGVGRQESAKIR